MDVGITAFDYPELLSSRLTIRDGRNKSPSCFAVREGSVCVPSRGESIACARVVRADSVGFYSFLFSLVLLAFGGCSPLCWQPPKASRVKQ